MKDDHIAFVDKNDAVHPLCTYMLTIFDNDDSPGLHQFNSDLGRAIEQLRTKLNKLCIGSSIDASIHIHSASLG